MTELSPRLLDDEALATYLDNIPKTEELALTRAGLEEIRDKLACHVLALTSELSLARWQLEYRADWSGEEVEDAIWRVREAAVVNARQVWVNSEDLRVLISSADGVADSYSRVLMHTVGLAKPTTDPRIACAMIDDQHSEEWNPILEERDRYRAELERIAQAEPTQRDRIGAVLAGQVSKGE